MWAERGALPDCCVCFTDFEAAPRGLVRGLHHECDPDLSMSEWSADILKYGCCSSGWVQEFTCGWSQVGEGSNLALVGERKQKESPVSHLYFLRAVCSVALTPSHATANPDFTGLWLRKENVRVNGWQHLQTTASCLEGRCRQCICFTKIMWLQNGGQIDIYPWTGSWGKGEIFFVENNIFLHSWKILILTYRCSPEFQASLNYYFNLFSLTDLEKWNIPPSWQFLIYSVLVFLLLLPNVCLPDSLWSTQTRSIQLCLLGKTFTFYPESSRRRPYKRF